MTSITLRGVVCALVAAAGLIATASPVHAFAYHQIEAVQKIVKDGEVVGARVHLIVDTDGYKQFRINVAPATKVPAKLKRETSRLSEEVVHRQTLTGARRGFVIKTLAEKTDAPKLVEMYVDIPYGRQLKPGQRVNLLSAFTKSDKGFEARTNAHTHIHGAWDGPTHGGDKAYVITLPGPSSKLADATETFAP